MTALVPAFFLTALLYAMVGFGGGSTYNALLVIADVDYRLLPAIALGCNIVVTAGSSIQFARHGLVPWRPLVPILVASVPMAFFGGRLPVEKWAFTALLGAALLVAGIALLLQDLKRARRVPAERRKISTFGLVGLGGGIGLLAGMVGIGGGIFLAPVLHLWRWQAARVIAAVCSVFILINSVAGLSGQLLKLDRFEMLGDVGNYALLFPAVLAGGLLGNRVNLEHLSAVWIRRGTGVLIVYVAARLLVATVGEFPRA